MKATLSLSRRSHLFIKDGALFIKLQQPNKHNPLKADFYILKKLSLSRLKEIHEWSGQILKEMGESK